MDPNTIALMQKMGVEVPQNMDEPDDDEVMKIMMENGFGGAGSKATKTGNKKAAAPMKMSEEDAIMAEAMGNLGNQAQQAHPQMTASN